MSEGSPISILDRQITREFFGARGAARVGVIVPVQPPEEYGSVGRIGTIGGVLYISPEVIPGTSGIRTAYDVSVLAESKNRKDERVVFRAVSTNPLAAVRGIFERYPQLRSPVLQQLGKLPSAA